MNLREISTGIFYCGVNDRSTTLFEGLWPLPYGVSYNSYLVKGSSASALIDTVEIGHSRDFLNYLRHTAGIGKIDYLVINHMEPDHSGSIPLLLDMFPQIKIVGNMKTIQMIRGFYHINDDAHFIEIKEGESISLGDKTLEFIMTPMVHWPETMMTYCPEEKALFSGDAFGTFGTLNGGLIDDDMECGMYIQEMYRYYSNIVGKYGLFVTKALSKTAHLPLDYICSTHGPVWHSMIPQVIEIVKRLAAWQPEPGVTIVYGSMYGNTADVADLFAIELNRLGIRNIKVHNATVENLSQIISDAFRYEGLIVGAPTYSNEVFPPVQTFLNAMRTREIKNKVTAAFGNHGWAPLATKAISATLEGMGLEFAGSVAMRQSMDDQTAAEVKAVAARFASLLSGK